MKLFIDNREIDLYDESQLRFDLSIRNLTSLDPKSCGSSNTIRIPATIRNRQVMLHCDQPFSASHFNRTPHTARVEVDGVVILNGNVIVNGYTSAHLTMGSYRLTLRETRKTWVKQAAKQTLKEIPIAFNTTLSDTNISASWTDSYAAPFRFLPVQRDRFNFNFNSPSTTPVRIFTVENYHPFLHLKTALKAITSASGYQIESEFIDSPFFNSLYVSGCYPTTNTELIRSRMAFNAGRTAESAVVTGVADGMVYANPGRTESNNLGNIVTTASSLDNPLFFNTNGCFTTIINKVAYIPLQSAIIGFEYDIKYYCSFRVVSSSELNSFNKVILDDGLQYKYTIQNSINILNNSTHFRGNLTLFSDTITSAGCKVRLKVQYETAQSGNPFVYINISKSQFDFTLIAYVAAVSLEHSYDGGITYVKQNTGWSLHYTVDLSGQALVQVKLRSTPKLREANTPIYFDSIMFFGNDRNQTIKLHKDTMVRPIFWEYPGLNSTVDTKRLMAHDGKYQIELFDSVRHMFNLYFYTDDVGKRIIIEPRDRFFKSKNPIDWCSKQDLERGIEISEAGTEAAQIMTLLYQDGDGAVARWNEDNKQKYSHWSATVQSEAAREEERSMVNPLFTPTMGNASVLPSAQSAYIINVGDRLRYNQPNDADLYVHPKIVRYMGMRKLSDTERWGWPAALSYYPFAAFHYDGLSGIRDPNHNSVECSDQATLIQKGMTLCFDDCGGQRGLHQFYDREFEIANCGRLITAYINLTPQDIEMFHSPARSDKEHDFRSLFQININGELIDCRLLNIEEYSPATNSSTKCTFLKEGIQ